MSFKKIPENFNDIPYKQITDIRKEIEGKFAQIPVSSDRNIQELDKKYIYDNIADRNEFSKDRDRIIFSKAFRRLEHKAQVYSHEKGDHYRTRLTHTIEVMQIARSIARNLGLNEDLTEAIALGHDIGHTAFGHQGEDVLDKIMHGKDDLGGKLEYALDYGGFKHNFNGLRTIDILERKYENEKGLNLTWQVIDGILKHTDIEKENNEWDINRFFKSKLWIEELLNYNYPVTLEGQIVSIADEIAQRQHDLDDGLRDKELKLTVNKIIRYIQDTIEYKTANNDPKDFEVKLLEELKDMIRNREKISSNGFSGKELDNYKWNSLIRDIIDYFIKDVTINSLENIYDIDSKRLMIKKSSATVNLEYDRKYFNSKIIDFSRLGKQLDKKLEDYIKNKILNSYSVNIFDGKAIYIVRQLFKAYYTNPKQMPEETLEKLSKRIKENTKLYEFEFKLKNKSISKIKFSTSHPNDINELITMLKLELSNEGLEELYKRSFNGKSTLNLNKEFLIGIKGDISDINEECKKCDENYDKRIIGKIFKKINDLDKSKIEKDKKMIFIKCLIEHHYAYLSIICDYIAGMTDNYANSQYNKLYLV